MLYKTGSFIFKWELLMATAGSSIVSIQIDQRTYIHVRSLSQKICLKYCGISENSGRVIYFPSSCKEKKLNIEIPSPFELEGDVRFTGALRDYELPMRGKRIRPSSLKLGISISSQLCRLDLSGQDDNDRSLLGRVHSIRLDDREGLDVTVSRRGDQATMNLTPSNSRVERPFFCTHETNEEFRRRKSSKESPPFNDKIVACTEYKLSAISDFLKAAPISPLGYTHSRRSSAHFYESKFYEDENGYLRRHSD